MKKCVACGYTIFKSARQDPYLCRGCEISYGLDIDEYWLDS